MIIERIEFQTVGAAAAHLVGQDFRQDDKTGAWSRADDGATASIERLSFSVRVSIKRKGDR